MGEKITLRHYKVFYTVGDDTALRNKRFATATDADAFCDRVNVERIERTVEIDRDDLKGDMWKER